MGIEMIIGLATALLAVIAGAFGLGHARGTNKAEAKAANRRERRCQRRSGGTERGSHQRGQQCTADC